MFPNNFLRVEEISIPTRRRDIIFFTLYPPPHPVFYFILVVGIKSLQKQSVYARIRVNQRTQRDVIYSSLPRRVVLASARTARQHINQLIELNPPPSPTPPFRRIFCIWFCSSIHCIHLEKDHLHALEILSGFKALGVSIQFRQFDRTK